MHLLFQHPFLLLPLLHLHPLFHATLFEVGLTLEPFSFSVSGPKKTDDSVGGSRWLVSRLSPSLQGPGFRSCLPGLSVVDTNFSVAGHWGSDRHESSHLISAFYHLIVFLATILQRRQVLGAHVESGCQMKGLLPTRCLQMSIVLTIVRSQAKSN